MEVFRLCTTRRRTGEGLQIFEEIRLYTPAFITGRYIDLTMLKCSTYVLLHPDINYYLIAYKASLSLMPVGTVIEFAGERFIIYDKEPGVVICIKFNGVR